MTVRGIGPFVDFIASDEDDSQHFMEKRMEALKETGLPTFEKILDEGDYVVWKAGGYYLVGDCGMFTLFKAYE